MINKSKAGSLFLMLIVMFLIAGCSSDTSGNSDVTKVVFWDLFSGNDGGVMTDIVEEFNEEHPDIEVEKITQEWGEYYTKLTTSVLGNQAPDLGVSHATRVPQLRAEGVIEPMDEAIDQVGINITDLSENAVNATTIDNEHYAVPFDYHMLLIFYNKAVLEDLGIFQDEKPEFNSYEEFVDTLLEIKEIDPDITPAVLTGQGTHPFRLWYSFYKQMGGEELYSIEEAKATIDPEIGKRSMQAVYDLYHTYEVIPPRIESSDELFQPGQAAFMINGTWSVNNNHEALGDDLGIIKFPKFFEKESVYADSHSFILPVNPDRDEETQEAAMTFVKWVSDNGWKWSEAGHLPVSNTVLESEELKEQPFRSEYESMAEYMEYLPPNEKTWFANSSELMDVFDGIWIDQYSVEEGIVLIEEIITKQLQD